jgi:hypothetical protein
MALRQSTSALVGDPDPYPHMADRGGYKMHTYVLAIL